MKKAAIAVLIAALLPGFLFAQTTTSGQTTSSQTTQPTSPPAGSSQTPSTGQTNSSGSSTQPSTGQAAQSNTPQAVPYAPDEFPLWLRQLRRAEIITVGAFPIALLLSSFGYQTVRYADHGYSQQYAPALFGTSATPLTNPEKIGILLGGAGLSVAVALADFIVGKLSKPDAGGAQP